MFLQKNNVQAPPLEFGAISKEDLLNMGAHSIAYIKPDAENGYRIYAGNGVFIDTIDDMKSAVSEIRSKNMVYVTLQ